MNSYTASCIVKKPKSEVFDFLADVENLPKWATAFVKEIKKIDGQYKAITPIGEVFFRFQTDAKSGVIDMYSGSKENSMTLAPLRVVSLSDSNTAVIFTIFQYDGVDNKSWQLFCDYIREEIENIKGIFS